jgi:hypothetical protein
VTNILKQPEASDEIALWLADEFTQVSLFNFIKWGITNIAGSDKTISLLSSIFWIPETFTLDCTLYS